MRSQVLLIIWHLKLLKEVITLTTNVMSGPQEWYYMKCLQVNYLSKVQLSLPYMKLFVQVNLKCQKDVQKYKSGEYL